MKVIDLLCILPLVLLSLAGCDRFTVSSGEAIIAKVNGQPIEQSAFVSRFEHLKMGLDETARKNAKVVDAVKIRTMNELIMLSLIRQEAKKNSIAIPREEVEGRLANWKEGYPPGGFEEMLRKQNTTEEFLKNRIEEQVLIEKLTERLFGAETLVSNEEMKKYFDDNKNEFFRRSAVHAYQIVVPTVEEAKKIREEISGNKITFESAARKYSLSPDAATGGDLGFFSMNEKISAFNKAFSLKVGEISQPIKSKYGVHLLKVVEKQPSKKLSFSEAKDDVSKSLKRKKESSAYQEWVTKLLKDGEIYKNESLYAKIN